MILVPLLGCNSYSDATTTIDELTEQDIPGAALNEPLESVTNHALRWWLLCRGLKASSSWRKNKLIERYV